MTQGNRPPHHPLHQPQCRLWCGPVASETACQLEFARAVPTMAAPKAVAAGADPRASRFVVSSAVSAQASEAQDWETEHLPPMSAAPQCSWLRRMMQSPDGS